MGAQGRSFSKETVSRIVWLLSSTDMTIQEITERMGCARSSVLGINSRFQVRDYGGFRSSWRPGSQETIDQAKKSA